MTKTDTATSVRSAAANDTAILQTFGTTELLEAISRVPIENASKICISVQDGEDIVGPVSEDVLKAALYRLQLLRQSAMLWVDLMHEPDRTKRLDLLTQYLALAVDIASAKAHYFKQLHAEVNGKGGPEPTLRRKTEDGENTYVAVITPQSRQKYEAWADRFFDGIDAKIETQAFGQPLSDDEPGNFGGIKSVLEMLVGGHLPQGMPIAIIVPNCAGHGDDL